MTLRVAVSLQQLSYLFYLVHHCGIEHFRTFLGEAPAHFNDTTTIR